MNKDKSMSYFINKISDFITTKVYVDKGPLEQNKNSRIDINEVKKIPLIKEERRWDEFPFVEKNLVKENEDKNKIDLNKKSQTDSNINFIWNEKINLNNNNKQEITVEAKFKLLSSEIKEFEDKIFLRIDENDYEGHIVVTNYRIIYKPFDENLSVKNPFPYYPEDYFDIPKFLINKIEKSNDKKNYNIYIIEMQTKDNRFLRFAINNDTKNFYGHIVSLVGPKTTDGCMEFAKCYREHHPVNNDGWKIYDIINEYLRQGVCFSDDENNNFDKKLRLSEVNNNFQLCSSYPELIFVPSSITSEELKEVANFRTKSRIPILCYFNKDNNASIWRSSQTYSGIFLTRSEKDEKMLQLIYELNIINSNNTTSSKKLNKLIIYDARPHINALANRIKGAGYENTDYYKNTEICFCDIDNIHIVRSSLSKMNTLVTNPKLVENKTFLSSLENSSWLHFIYQIIKSAVDVSYSVKNGYSILIHCSDGWDRTSQLTSLSQLLIDPYYRTLEGFCVLIEKEWLSFGHQFGLRNGFYNPKDHSEEQSAPIFLQWLDCVHQFLIQFPHIFEFNMDTLLFIAYHLNSCKYGTFIFNSEYERNEKKAKEKTVSIWTDILENKQLFTNPFYKPETFDDKQFKYILPNFAFYKIRFWEEYFLRYLNFNFNISISKLFNNYKNKTKEPESMLQTNKIITGNKNNIISNIYSKTTKNKSNFQYIESEKLNQQKIINEQREEIKKLNEIVKEISSKIIFKISDFNGLSTDSKNYLLGLNNGEIIEEDGYVLVKNSTMNK